MSGRAPPTAVKGRKQTKHQHEPVKTSAHDIMNRLNEISLNASLFAERVNAHRITLADHKTYTADTKLETDYDFFRALHAAGRGAAVFARPFRRYRVRSTFDLRGEAEAGVREEVARETPMPQFAPQSVTHRGARYDIFVADITTHDVDAIVNAANTSLLGVAGSTARSTAPPDPSLSRNAEGSAAAHRARLDSPADTVIHTVGPIWQGGTAGEDRILEAATIRALR